MGDFQITVETKPGMAIALHRLFSLIFVTEKNCDAMQNRITYKIFFCDNLKFFRCDNIAATLRLFVRLLIFLTILKFKFVA